MTMPIVFVPKMDRSLHCSVDYYRLNTLTLYDMYPVFRIDECIDTVEKEKLFLTSDANSECLQIKMDGRDVEKMTLATHTG